MFRGSWGLIAFALLIGSIERVYAENQIVIDFTRYHVVRSDGSVENPQRQSIDESTHYFFMQPSGQVPIGGFGIGFRNWINPRADEWSLIFAPPVNQALSAETYTDVTPLVMGDPGHIGIAISGTSDTGELIRCSYPHGTLDINRIDYRNNRVTLFNGSFDIACCWEPSCNPASLEQILFGPPPRIAGSLHYNICLAADLNNDGRVDITDLALMLSSFGSSGRHPFSIGNDFNVDLPDLSLLLEEFGSTCSNEG